MNLKTMEDRLREANRAYEERAAIPDADAQPVHTVYGGAHLFRAHLARRMGDRARAAMDEQALDAPALAELLAVEVSLAERVLARVREKLRAEPVEDYRIDFEDGYGTRPDDEEDGHARAAAGEVIAGIAAGSLPPRIGFRIKPLHEATRVRAERTLAVFLDTLLAGGPPPPGFVVTLPKVVIPEQAAYLAARLGAIEADRGLAPGALRMELMVETPDALITRDGHGALAGLVAAGGGRVVAAHFGAYDYTAALGIAAAEQRLRHPACDWARAAMQIQLAGSGVWLVDGATTTLPVPVHRGDALGSVERDENRRAVLAAWRLHAADVHHGLASGFYAGWDLHPAQLVSRYAAVYAFFLGALPAAAARLRNFVERAAQATRVGVAFDDAATGQGLLNFFRRALSCGAVGEDEVEDATGLARQALRARTFAEFIQAPGPGAARHA